MIQEVIVTYKIQIPNTLVVNYKQGDVWFIYYRVVVISNMVSLEP
jgi:hypothetical protein